MQPSLKAISARWLFGIAACLTTAALLAVIAWVQLSPTLPLEDPTTPRPSLVLVNAQGEPFARRGSYREAPVDAARLPGAVVAPFLAIEDRRFYEHGGLDMRGIARAGVANLAAGGVKQGGSTITQQLAKIAFVGNARSFGRKFREAIVALRLEKQHSKDAILSAYLSRVYFGDGVYGLGGAARHYFGKDAADLDVAEAAMLAGVVNAPSRLAPSRHLADAEGRAGIVLAAMADAGYLTTEEAGAISPAQPQATPALMAGSYFADWIGPQARGAAGQGYGQVAVQTTLDSALQQSAEAIVWNALARYGGKGKVGQAALVAMRADGSVVAMVGGHDYRQSQYNRAVQAKRQPGSAFKLFVYLAALRGGAHGDTIVSNGPLKVAGWSPRNYSNRYGGPIPLTRAFAQSSNVAAVRLSEQVGRGAVIQAAHDLGLHGEIKPLASVALGTSATTLLDLTAAYASVAAGAYPGAPVGLADRATDRWSQTPMSYEERVPLLTMLNAAVETGTGRAARLPLPAFGKTGTTQDNRDAWFVGFAGDLIVGVWVGNDDETPMKGVTGGGLPARIWHDFMTSALSDEIAAAATLQAEAEADAMREEAERRRQENEPDWWDRFVDSAEQRRWLT